MNKFTAAVVSALGLVGLAQAQGSPNLNANGAAFSVHSAPVCPGPASAGTAHCHARVVTDAHGVPIATGVARSAAAKSNHPGKGGGGGGGNPPPPPSGAYGTVQFRTAYGLTSASGSGKTVVIVDAYDDPNAESDLAVYGKAYGLPSCPPSNGCFRKIDQNGGTNYPRADSGWALEISLDVQAVHAVCPDCSIVLVEARSNRLSDLLTAEVTAASFGSVISNSWGAGEFSSESAYDAYLGGLPTTFSSGDSGYGVEWPAASTSVTSVGGTTLTLKSDNTRDTETVWGGSGSGCSAYEASLDYQSQFDTVGCGHRMVADIAADADPATGAAVYDSYGYAGMSGWFTVGGTSLASPIIAAVYALSGNTAGASTIYSNYSKNAPFDVTHGSNGSCGTLLCQGTVGYDGPTGLGTPDGLSPF